MTTSVTRIKVPRFSSAGGFIPSSEKATKTLSKVKRANTRPEILLRKGLWNAGVRYRLSMKEVLGKPDVVLAKQKVVIFVDGDFWHGFNWDVRKPKLRTNRDYWIPKIERNMQRDIEVTASLTAQGWRVLRLWEHELVSNSNECIAKALKFIQGTNHQPT